MNLPPRSLNPFRVLQTHRNFRLFWFGQTLSLVGTWMQTMAQGWLSLELSHSALVVGLVASVGALPVLLFSMHAGAIVDRGDRLRIVKITQAVFMVQAALLWYFTWSNQITIEVLLVLALVQGTCSAIEIPARQSMIVQLVGLEDLTPAIALNSSGFNLARVIGPAVGGLVIHQFGIAWCFGLNALSYFAVFWGLLRIRLPASADTFPRGGLAHTWRESTVSVRAGLKFLRGQRLVRDLLGLVSVGAVFGGPFLTLMPVVAKERLGLEADGYAGLLASVGVGGLVGALMLAGPATHWRRGPVLVVSSLAFPALLIAFALNTSVSMAHLILQATGCAMIVFNALTNGLLQLMVPEEYRGRLMALYSLIVVGLSQVGGSLLAGIVARQFGVAVSIGTAAAITLVYAGWTLHREPELVRV